ncbi:ComEC/Rec2 family competence protein [Halosolutus amylolyticus]|uniref:ComEC/Rec2 family competence protein n=1 Tax=Halosolutus amylolyticus TaxID=2932267 RepID=A0ABD5PS23_9EURY|nr:MBL fold metallo-hydrolase [Halosolutus amylolyticus]
MRRGLVVVLVAGLVVSAGYAVGFGASDEYESENADLDGELEVHHVDVGQGDATLIVTPHGETILIDSGDWRDDGRDVIDYLESQGIDRVDHLIATHGHADHIGGHAAVIEHFEEHGDGVGAVYDTGVVHTSQTYEEYLDAVEGYDVTLFEVGDGYDLSLENDAVEASVVHPPADTADRTDDLDYSSLVLAIEFGEFTYLTTGDAGGDAEQRLVEQRSHEIDADAYQVGHHGSSSSSTEPFLDAVDPQVAIVSSAADSQYGHPHDEVLESLADRNVRTYWTGVHGDVVLETDGRTVSMTTERDASTDPLDLLEAKHAPRTDHRGNDSSTTESDSNDLPTADQPTIDRSTTVPTEPRRGTVLTAP